MQKEVLQILQHELSLQLKEGLTEEDIKERIAARINYLIQHDFTQLTQVLYRIDVNEDRLKHLLNDAREKDAADIIAALIIERQIQKFESRKAFKQNNDISEEEKW